MSDWGTRPLARPDDRLPIQERLQRARLEGEAAGRAAAEQEASELRERLQSEHEEAMERLQEAHRAALAMARQDAREELVPLVQSLAQADAELRDGRQAWLDALGDNVLALSLALARELVGREVSEDPEVVRGRVERALERLPVAEKQVRIHLHPDDVDLLRSEDLRPVVEGLLSSESVEWASDARIQRGGCLIEAGERLVDGRIESGLTRLYERLRHE